MREGVLSIGGGNLGRLRPRPRRFIASGRPTRDGEDALKIQLGQDPQHVELGEDSPVDDVLDGADAIDLGQDEGAASIERKRPDVFGADGDMGNALPGPEPGVVGFVELRPGDLSSLQGILGSRVVAEKGIGCHEGAFVVRGGEPLEHGFAEVLGDGRVCHGECRRDQRGAGQAWPIGGTRQGRRHGPFLDGRRLEDEGSGP